jgi:hypothetical protein
VQGKPRKKQKTEPVKKTKDKSKGKERASERTTIPIPEAESDEEQDLGQEEGIEYFEQSRNIQFLASLDRKGIARYVLHHYVFWVANALELAGARKRHNDCISLPSLLESRGLLMTTCRV